MREAKTAPAELVSPRNFLIKVHRDLFKISSRMSWDFFPDQLNSVEVMVLISEDRRFFWHRGFDTKSIYRELFRLMTFRRHGGASTIDMQLVRTITGYRKRTLRRKLYEILLAWLIQFKYSKYEILRSYLNCAFFGSHIKGVHAAAGRVFQKRPESLTIDEAAVIASMLVYPRPLVPTPQWEGKIKRRSDYIKRLYPSMKQRFEKLPVPEIRDRFAR